MIVSVAAGMLLGEGFSRFQRSAFCPSMLQEKITILDNSLKETLLVQIISCVFISTVLSHLSLITVAKCLKNRVSFVSTPCQWIALKLGSYRRSLPLLFAFAIYLGRREALLTLFERLKDIYECFEEINRSLGDLDLSQKVQQELSEGVRGICESARYMLFAHDPSIIRTIDKEIRDFEEHLRSIWKKIPHFEKKLDACYQLLTKTRSEVSQQINEMELCSSELHQLFTRLDGESSGFWEEAWKGLLGYHGLLKKREEYHCQLETLKDTASKIDLMISGIGLLYQADREEIGAIRRWNIYIKYTPLPVLEDAFLCVCDMPNMSLKAFNEIVFKTKERGDDLWSHRRRRIKLNETFPTQVSKFSQALTLFKQARKATLDCLTGLEVAGPLTKEDWEEERALLRQGRVNFNDADLVFCAKLFPSHPTGQFAKAVLKA